MAFKRKDIKKAYYYVWFLGAKESKGLRGEQYILPVLKHLLSLERHIESCKVTIQVNSKGLKIIQNVPKKQSLQSGHYPNILSTNQTNFSQNKNSLNSQPAQNSTVKMEQIKHFIPHHAITCALQKEDVVCIILLLYNPLTGCPVHVHSYRCDSIETAVNLKNQLQLLIDRPENQRKFSEIEARLAAKGLISQRQLLNNNFQQNPSNQLLNNSVIQNKPTQIDAVEILNSENNSFSKKLKQKKVSETTIKNNVEETDEYKMNLLLKARIEQEKQIASNKSLAESKSSSGNSSGSSPQPPQTSNPLVIEMYENLAAELKAKLGNPKTGPILLPPRDYDTVCRSQGKLIELNERACTNKLVVGLTKKTEKNEKTQVDLNKSEVKTCLEKKSNSKKIISKEKEEIKQESTKIIKDSSENKIIKKESLRTNIENKDLNEKLKEQAMRLNHNLIKEQQQQYQKKLLKIQKQQEAYEQQQLLLQQQQQVRLELSQQHKPSKFIEEMVNGKLKKNKVEDKKELEVNSVIHSGGIKQIGSNLANKIKNSLIGSSKDKLQPQLICHKTLHDSLQNLNKITKLETKDKFNKNLKQIDDLLNKEKEKSTQKINTETTNTNKSSSNISNSSSSFSKDFNEKLNTIKSRSDSSNVSKSVSSGIGSAANLNKNVSNYDEQHYLSTDEELDEEVLIHNLNECVDEYMPNYVYDKYLNDEDYKRKLIDRNYYLLNKNSLDKFDYILSNEKIQLTSSEEDDGINSICYDENLMPKINTAKRSKKINRLKSLKNENGVNYVNKNISYNDHSSLKKKIQTSNPNLVRRSETYYEVNQSQKKNFFENFRFSHKPIESNGPKLFYFPNPEFKAPKQTNQSQTKKYHLGQNKQCELRRQKSTPSILINDNFNQNYYQREQINNVIDLSQQKTFIYPRTRPISMVNIQPEHLNISNHQLKHEKVLNKNLINKIPIYY